MRYASLSNSTLSDFMLSAPHSPCWEPLCHYNWPTQVRALLFHEESVVKHLAAHHWGTRVGLQVRRSGEISLSGDSCAETWRMRRSRSRDHEFLQKEEQVQRLEMWLFLGRERGPIWLLMGTDSYNVTCLRPHSWMVGNWDLNTGSVAPEMCS